MFSMVGSLLKFITARKSGCPPETSKGQITFYKGLTPKIWFSQIVCNMINNNISEKLKFCHMFRMVGRVFSVIGGSSLQ